VLVNDEVRLSSCIYEVIDRVQAGRTLTAVLSRLVELVELDAQKHEAVKQERLLCF